MVPSPSRPAHCARRRPSPPLRPPQAVGFSCSIYRRTERGPGGSPGRSSGPTARGSGGRPPLTRQAVRVSVAAFFFVQLPDEPLRVLPGYGLNREEFQLLVGDVLDIVPATAQAREVAGLSPMISCHCPCVTS